MSNLENINRHARGRANVDGMKTSGAVKGGGSAKKKDLPGKLKLGSLGVGGGPKALLSKLTHFKKSEKPMSGRDTEWKRQDPVAKENATRSQVIVGDIIDGKVSKDKAVFIIRRTQLEVINSQDLNVQRDAILMLVTLGYMKESPVKEEALRILSELKRTGSVSKESKDFIRQMEMNAAKMTAQ